MFEVRKQKTDNLKFNGLLYGSVSSCTCSLTLSGSKRKREMEHPENQDEDDPLDEDLDEIHDPELITQWQSSFEMDSHL